MACSGKIRCKNCDSTTATLIASFALYDVPDVVVRREKCATCGKTITYLHSKLNLHINLIQAALPASKVPPSQATRSIATEAMEALVHPSGKYLKEVLIDAKKADKAKIEVARWAMDWGLQEDRERGSKAQEAQAAADLDAHLNGED